MLLNGQGQAQGSSGLNNNPIKAEAKVRWDFSLDVVEMFCCHHIFSSHVISYTFCLFSFAIFSYQDDISPVKVVDEGRMLLNGQTQCCSGLNNNPNKREVCGLL